MPRLLEVGNGEDGYNTIINGEDGYNTIINAFQNFTVGCHARAILINPLHPGYPKIPVLIHPSCNRFDAEFVQNQWDQTQHFYNEHLREFIGPLLGRASDGDSRRRKLMLRAARDTSQSLMMWVSSSHAWWMKRPAHPRT